MALKIPYFALYWHVSQTSLIFLNNQILQHHHYIVKNNQIIKRYFFYDGGGNESGSLIRKGTSKKDILCKFYKNCREGKQCEYFHPISKKNSIDEESKNWGKEMYKNVHFLTKQLKKIAEEVTELKKIGRKQDGESQDKMP